MRSSFNKVISMKEYKVLYICDDKAGYPEVIAKALACTIQEALIILEGLTQRGFIIRDDEDNDFYVSTKKGKYYLKQFANKYTIDPREL